MFRATQRRGKKWKGTRNTRSAFPLAVPGSASRGSAAGSARVFANTRPQVRDRWPRPASLLPPLVTMAYSMIQRRQKAERERIEVYDAALRRARRRSRPAQDFHKAIEEAARGFTSEVVRDPGAWRPQLKTRDAARLRLAAARHLFARYPVPAALERIWIDDAGLDAEEVWLRRHWYVVVARGGSLYQAGAGQWLTRKEIHSFLNPPAGLDFDAAFWQAIARSYVGEPGPALCIARSRIARAAQRDRVLARGGAVLLQQPRAGGSDRRPVRLPGLLLPLRSRLQSGGAHAGVAQPADARMASRHRGHRAHRGDPPPCRRTSRRWCVCV